MKPHWTLLLALAGCDALDDDDDPGPPPPTPVAHDDSVTVDEDSRTFVRTAVKDNDEGVTTSTTVTYGMPLHGTWVGGAENFSPITLYQPDPGYHGPDQFTYELKNALGETSTATVTIDVASDGIRYEDSRHVDGYPAAGAAVGDLDADGRVDIVVVTPATSNLSVLANRTTAPGQFAVEAFRFEGGHSPVGVAIVDLDLDGRSDVVTASGTDGLVVLRNITAPGGPLGFAAPVLLPSGDAIAVVALDLDGNGQADLVALDKAGEAMQVRINTSTPGSLSFGVRTAFATPRGPTQLLASDANGDGTLDLAVLSRTAGALSLFVNATAIGEVVPAFATRIDRATGTQPASMFLADLDGDARDELAVLHDNDALWVYANRSSGTSTPMYEAARVLQLTTSSSAIAAPFDLDGQGPIDVLVAVSGDHPFAQLVNQSAQAGSYVFDVVDSTIGDVVARKRASYSAPTALIQADLDGAGAPEIILTSHAYGSSAGGTYVLFDR